MPVPTRRASNARPYDVVSIYLDYIRANTVAPLQFEGVRVWLLQRTVGDACPYGADDQWSPLQFSLLSLIERRQSLRHVVRDTSLYTREATGGASPSPTL